MGAADAARLPFGIRPADKAERLIGPVLVEGAEVPKRECPAIG
jgi:hypothetical protein